MIDFVKKAFKLGDADVQAYCSWFNDDGEKWEFCCQVSDTNCSSLPVQLSSTSPTNRTIDRIIDALNNERAFCNGTDEQINGATNIQKMALANWITKSASNLKPTCSAHDDYFGS